MRIGIDASYLQFMHHQAGLYQYTQQLIYGLQEIDQENDYTLFFFNWKRVQEWEKAIRSYSFNQNTCKRVCRIPYRVVCALAKWAFPVDSILGKVDVFHGPIFRLFPRGCYKKSVVTIHDLNFMKHPELFASARGAKFYRELAVDAIGRADVLVAVSEFTRNEILELFPIPPERTRVIYNGVGREFVPVQDPEKIGRIREKYGLWHPYLLFVGFLEARKNLLRLLDAFAEARKSLPEHYQLVLAGSRGPSTGEILRRIGELSLEKEVLVTGYVPREDLSLLYAGAAVFVFPSLREGFGIPPLEAMACGTPVIASNVAALPEVVGSAGLLVDPLETEELAQAISSVLTREDLRAALRQRGLERARQFSWERTARQTLQLYEELC